MRELARAREVGKGHSSRIMYLLECVWLSLHVHLGGE